MSIELQNYQSTDRAYVWNTYATAMKGHIESMWGWEEVWQKNDFDKNLKYHQTRIVLSENERAGYLQTKVS